MKVAVVGATGLVGSTMLQVLQERKFPVSTLIPVASENSIGKHIRFGEKEFTVVSSAEAVRMQPDVALFSAGAAVSREWAPAFAAVGTTVIDNSSCWRMDNDVPLVVPEINGEVLTSAHRIIANPNCSTIQMVMVLNPLYQRYGIKRIVVSTYQSVSGSGAKGLLQLNNERANKNATRLFPHQIDLNCIPQVDVFVENGNTREEMKMVNETRKIMRTPFIQLSTTCVRVPVKGGHSESVNVEFENEFELDDIFSLLRNTPGICVYDEPMSNRYPMPLDAEGKDDVFVGRIRRDHSQARTLNCWIVADNLRKGAATNAVQIAEYLATHHLLHESAKQAG